MKIKGLVVTGLAMTMLVTGCGNMGDNGATTRDNVNDSLNVNYDNMGRYTENVRNNNMNTRRVNENNDPRLEVADEATDKITDLEEVQSCNILVTNRNAYVAAVLDNNSQDLSKDVEEKIANQVRETDPNIRNVYVSVNPEFVQRMEGYTNDVRSGRPIAGMFDEFSEMIRRVFPTAR